MSFLDTILKFASGDGSALGSLETDARQFIVNGEKIIADLAAGHGNVIASVLALASDFQTVIAEVQEAKKLLVDLQALIGAAQSAAPVVPAVAEQVLVPSVMINPALHIALATAATITAGSDPFAAKPLAHAAQTSEPHGGA